MGLSALLRFEPGPGLVLAIRAARLGLLLRRLVRLTLCRPRLPTLVRLRRQPLRPLIRLPELELPERPELAGEPSHHQPSAHQRHRAVAGANPRGWHSSQSSAGRSAQPAAHQLELEARNGDAAAADGNHAERPDDAPAQRGFAPRPLPGQSVYEPARASQHFDVVPSGIVPTRNVAVQWDPARHGAPRRRPASSSGAPRQCSPQSRSASRWRW